ncbi:hypothetical protein CI109_100184 [Kwoniella shandongensis]|uniref:Uncharacterized protein n=1 Tax=Kwoniella shandongensis TaxID=1734106 RepID=A0A5M6BVA0_9TREE|nr:uncharacterized protein CI109_005784 [Kwoniella shandongensis]KAA5525902.1 hypothetical protein CI109_005784 [Kwoniella shandongensis]
MSLTGGYINDMHWQSYRLNGSLTPEIERELRHQASRAFSNIHSQLGFSVSTSITTVNGITTASTLLQIGKGTPWTEAERKELERRFLKAVPRGNIIG